MSVSELHPFVSFSERDGPAGTTGRELLDLTGVLFDYWHDYRDGKLPRERFLAWMKPVQEQFKLVLARAVAQDINGVSGSCANMLAHEKALWTFVTTEGVEPTNNHAYAARGISVCDRHDQQTGGENPNPGP